MALTEPQKNKIKFLRKEGLGYGTIASEIGATRDQVRDFCRGKKIKLTGERGEATKEKKVCNKCGNEYMSKTTQQKFCSDECRIANSKKQLKKSNNDCLVCGSETKSAKEKYCSDECRGTRRVCVVCHKTFIDKNKSKKFCSGECLSEHRIKRLDQRITKVCLNCGDDFITTKRKDGKFCSLKCNYKHKGKSHSQFIKELFEIHGGFIVPLEMYHNSDQLLECKCLKCGNVMKKKAHRYIGTSKKGCASCSGRTSKGATEVEDWLIDNNLSYKTEYYFDDLKMSNYLFFDFAVFDGEELLTLIEYDGRQHFEPIESWGGQVELERIQESDRIKDEYCQNNNLPLIRIKYDSKNIEEVLNEKVKKKNLI